MHFTGYRTAHLQIQLANVHTYYNPNYTRKNKSKYNVILKIRFHGQLGWQKVLMTGYWSALVAADQ